MIAGITETEEQIIKNILNDFTDKYSFYYYGSRVKGNFEKTSDLDILIKGDSKIDVGELAELNQKFDNSKLPYVTNLTDYYAVDEKFYNLIEKDLVQIF